MFRPSIVGLFINPLYFVRRGIYKGIVKNASFMKGLLLDFGCGKKPYQMLFNVYGYVGLEIWRDGQAGSGKTVDVFYDGKTLPFLNDSFDSIFTSEVFEHIFNVDHVLSEIHRVMKPGGYILITLPFVWEEHEAPWDFARYTSYAISHILNQSGFDIVVIDKSSNYIETSFQLFIAYIIKLVSMLNPAIRVLFNCVFVAPLTVLGVIVARCLPENRDLYLNNIIVAQKRREVL